MQPILAVTLPFFALVLMGYAAAHRRLLPESAIPGLNAFVLYFALPALLFRFGMNTPIGQLLNPVVLIEVLSPSNLRETWESIRACATIPSLAEIMVVDSERVLVEIYRKLPEGGWPTEPDERAQSGAIKLTSIEANLDVADIYSGTHLV
mgnify:CR=1 FL=1